jgi:hypothetical protein
MTAVGARAVLLACVALVACAKAPPPAPRVTAPDEGRETAVPPQVDDVTAQPQVDDVTAQPQVDDVTAQAPVDIATNTQPQDEVAAGPEPPPVDHCAAFFAALEPDLFLPLPRQKKPPCKIVATLAAPPVVALVISGLPSPEGKWTAARVAVAAGGRWYATPYAGSLELAMARVEPAPMPGTFSFETKMRGLELGAGEVQSVLLTVCHVASGAGAVPRCADQPVGGAFKPLDAAHADQAEDWQVPWTFTPEGVQFGPVRGKIDPATERAAAATLTLEALLASGVDLELE